MNNRELMDFAEIHRFGVSFVCAQMTNEGYKIISINKDFSKNPQIIAKKDDSFSFVLVRTQVYPKKGKIRNDALIHALMAYGNKHRAVCYFAGIELSNPKAKNEKQKGRLVKGSSFDVDYDGLWVISPPDNIKVFHDVIINGN
ncbi:MAG: hypothetical protein KAI43_02935 [Candidatus Aureabacteria bacterium]|nr:hypothetical protein [Candidatus Auribacterota bacterium]